MGTRLLSEQRIKETFPHLRYIRIHTGGRNAATIYAWDDDLKLPADEAAGLKRFASEHLSPYVCFRVKAYAMVQPDGVPQIGELPEAVRHAALNRSLDRNGVLEVMNGMLGGRRMTFERYDDGTGTLHFEIRRAEGVTAIEKELIRQYLYEIIPLGCLFEVTYAD